MKSVSGKVISTKAVSLSKAAKILSNFVSADNGGSQSVSVYLRRASASFNELVQFRKEQKGSHSDPKRKKHRPKGIEDRNPIKIEENPVEAEEVRLENMVDSRKHKKHRLKSLMNGNPIKTEENPGKAVANGLEDVEENCEHKKHRSKVENQTKIERRHPKVEEEAEENVEDTVRSDKKKKRREDGVSLEIEDDKRRAKKERKSGVFDHGEVVDSAEQSSSKKKKKRRKVEGEN